MHFLCAKFLSHFHLYYSSTPKEKLIFPNLLSIFELKTKLISLLVLFTLQILHFATLCSFFYFSFFSIFFVFLLNSGSFILQANSYLYQIYISYTFIKPHTFHVFLNLYARFYLFLFYLFI